MTPQPDPTPAAVSFTLDDEQGVSSPLAAMNSSDAQRAPPGTQAAALSLPWWIGALPISALYLWQLALILNYGHRPWDTQPRWIRWLANNPVNAQMTHFALAAISLLCVALYVCTRRRGWWEQARWKRVSAVLLSLLVFAAGARYFVSKPCLAKSWTHAHDTYHYLLGPKYFPEMGYDLLYACTVEVVAPADIPAAARVRDLRSYRTTTALQIREQAECADKLSAARLEEFRSDVALFQRSDLLGPLLSGATTDHGFNGTPLHTLLAGGIASRVPLTLKSLVRLQLIDVTAVCLMLGVVCWGFGWRYGLLFALMVFTLPADRWSLIGASYFRYVWLCALICGLTALHKERWVLAGTLLSLSALLNLFPVVFLGGAGVAVLGDAWRARKITVPLREFSVAVATSLLVLGLMGAAHAHSSRNYSEFASKMAMHLDDPPNKKGERVERLPGFAIGLKMAFNYRGEHGLKRSPAPVKQAIRSRQLREVEWLIRVSGLGLFVWALVLGLRLSALEASVLIGFTGMFSVMTLLGYYFAAASSLVLMLKRPSQDSRGALLLVGLFAINAAGLYYYAQTLNKFGLYNNVLTFSWLAFLLAILVSYSRRTGLGDRILGSRATSSAQDTGLSGTAQPIPRR